MHYYNSLDPLTLWVLTSIYYLTIHHSIIRYSFLSLHSLKTFLYSVIISLYIWYTTYIFISPATLYPSTPDLNSPFSPHTLNSTLRACTLSHCGKLAILSLLFIANSCSWFLPTTTTQQRQQQLQQLPLFTDAWPDANCCCCCCCHCRAVVVVVCLTKCRAYEKEFSLFSRLQPIYVCR